MIAWGKKLFGQLMQYERCSKTFALSCCVGIYIAFSPFVGFHTVMVFLFSWLFALNFTVVLTISMFINNPWTMVPVYSLGYFFGDRFLSLFGMNHDAWNPSWITKGNELLASYVGVSGFSFWAFMIGGNVLGIVLSLLSYPLLKILAALTIRGKKRVLNTVNKSKRAVHSLTQKAKPVLHRVVEKQKQYRKEYEIGDAE